MSQLKCYCFAIQNKIFISTGPCDGDKCKNGGTCTPTSTGFECSCVEPYSGKTCESSMRLEKYYL